MPKAPPPPNLPALLPSWLLSLRADRKSDQTVKVYGDGVRFYLRWCERVGAAPLERSSLRGWVTELMDGANRPATARARQHAVRRFTAWLAEEGELAADPFLGMANGDRLLLDDENVFLVPRQVAQSVSDSVHEESITLL